MITLKQTSIADVWSGTSDLISDERGEFSRIFCEKSLKTAIGNQCIRQINISKTNAIGTVRGLHYQISPFEETKVVRCLSGEIFDVAVDLRKNSKTFLKYTSFVLSADKNNFVVIPEGLAHGFQALTANCELLYLHTEFYTPKSERSINVKDPMVNIAWPLPITQISDKDKSINYLNSNFVGY